MQKFLGLSLLAECYVFDTIRVGGADVVDVVYGVTVRLLRGYGTDRQLLLLLHMLEGG